jgi:hypothetical protein
MEIAIRNASRYLAEERISDVGIVKIDVEGFEPAVLRGLRSVLDRDRPFILLELSTEGLAELGGESGFKSCLYKGAELLKLEGNYNYAHTLTPHRFEARTSEILIVPREHIQAFQ